MTLLEEFEAIVALKGSIEDKRISRGEWLISRSSELREALRAERRQGHSALRGRPLDENGNIELTTFDPHPASVAPAPAPAAWLHAEHRTAYVITNRVKEIWLGADPKHVEHYTIPLYAEHLVTIRRELPKGDANVKPRAKP